MKIEIADRLKPFSHMPGHSVMIPGTRFHVKAFPTALMLIEGVTCVKEFALDLKGPVNPFTVEQDLEGRQVRVYGEALQGYFRLSIKTKESSLVLCFEKTPSAGITIEGKTFFSGDALEIARDVVAYKDSFQERLFLGSSKQKENDMIRRRRDLREILPLWHLLGAITPQVEEKDTFTLIDEAIEKKEKQTVLDLLTYTYLAHFSSGLVPRKEDEERQRLSPVIEFSENLLSKGYSSIRSLFFQEKEDGFYFLPCVLPLFVCGKLIQVKSKTGCLIDIEWTKHSLRRVHILIEKDQLLKLHLPKEVKSFRVKRAFKDRGKVLDANGSEIAVRAGDHLWLDLFQR